MSPPDDVQVLAVLPPARAARASAPLATLRRARIALGPAAGVVVPAALLVLWEALARAGVVPANWLPGPTAIAETVRALAVRGELLGHVVVTVGRVAAGFALGAGAGTALGIATGRSETTRALLDPLLQALRSIPSLAWVPLFLLWLGIGEGSKVALIAVGAAFPVYLNLESGIREVDRRLVEVGQVFRLSGLALVRRVILPATLPAYVVGLRAGLGLAWMFVVAAELMGASRGLGFLMVDGQTTSRPELVLASLVLFAILGKLSDRGLVALGRRVVRGGA